MKRFILASAALLAFSAQADLVATNGRDTLRLTQAPCTSGVILPMIREEFRSQFKAGSAEIAGKRFETCWIDSQDGAYFLFFDDGDTLAISVAAFAEAGI